MRNYVREHCPTVTQLCRVFSIHRTTFYDWLKEFPELAAALQAAREESLARLADLARTSLEKLVTGFKFTETTRELVKDKLEITKKVRKFIVPSERAIEFVLKNVEADIWKDRQEIDHNLPVPVTVINYADTQGPGYIDYVAAQLPAQAVSTPAPAGDGQRVPSSGGGVAPESGQGQDLD